MSHARHVLGIAEAANIDVDRGTGFVSVWVMNQQGLELVGEADDAVGAVVELWRFQAIS